jgi:hypothetical protein
VPTQDVSERTTIKYPGTYELRPTGTKPRPTGELIRTFFIMDCRSGSRKFDTKVDPRLMCKDAQVRIIISIHRIAAIKQRLFFDRPHLLYLTSDTLPPPHSFTNSFRVVPSLAFLQCQAQQYQDGLPPSSVQLCSLVVSLLKRHK